MAFDYTRLRERIIEKCGSNTVFAERMGLSYISVSSKLNNRRKWTQSDMLRASEILGFSPEELGAYFFPVKDGAITANSEVNTMNVEDLSIKIDVKNIDELTEKASRLNELLKETINLLGSIKEIIC